MLFCDECISLSLWKSFLTQFYFVLVMYQFHFRWQREAWMYNLIMRWTDVSQQIKWTPENHVLELLEISPRRSFLHLIWQSSYRHIFHRRVDTSGPHLINELRYLPHGKCLTLSEQRSLIKTAAYQFRLVETSQEFSHKLLL